MLHGERTATLALHPVVDGVATLVPGAAAADFVLALDGLGLVSVSPEGSTRVDNLGSMAVADVSMENASEVSSGDGAVAAYEAAIDEWLVLTAAALQAIGTRALEIGVEYVKERKAFGVPIGSFQAISHRLADSAAALDGAQLFGTRGGLGPRGGPGAIRGTCCHELRLRLRVRPRPRLIAACISTAATAS